MILIIGIGQLRDELLNEMRFTSLAEARAAFAAWKHDYKNGLSNGYYIAPGKPAPECPRRKQKRLRRRTPRAYLTSAGRVLQPPAGALTLRRVWAGSWEEDWVRGKIEVIKSLAELRAKYDALAPIRYIFNAEDAALFDDMREEIEALENMVARAPTEH